MMQTPLPQCGAILAAGGIGTRMAAGQPKQFLNLAGLPILVRSCRILLALPEVARLVVVAPEAHLDHCQRLCREFLPEADQARLVFTAGGVTRQDSVRAGLSRLDPAPPLVLVHDAARPLADAALCRRVLAGAAKHGAAIAALPVTDTIKEVEADDKSGGFIRATLDRGRLWQAQTPQAVRLDLWRAALVRADEAGFQATDEAALLEHAGIPVRVVLGSPANIKITRPEDLRIAEALLAKDKTIESRDHRQTTMKIGHGFDAHRLVAGRKLILGGVEIAHPLGLLGHSDADVACHALMDAILGALGLGDIGRHFPDKDPAFAGADSLNLLARVTRLMAEQGFRLGNADLTIVCQRPKLAPHLPEMRANLARACGADANRVNVKATTTEEMGYAGRGEGIAAHAVVLLETSA